MNTGSGSRYSFPRFRLAFVAAGIFTCLSSAKVAAVEIVAHRGGYLVAPENTLAAFQACSGLVDRIEFDVYASADGELVVIHDATVNRTATGYGSVTNVAELTLAELKLLDVGAKFSPAFAGERIPTFAEALRAMPPGISAMVHRKTGTTSNFVAVLRAENALSNTIIATDDYGFLIDMRQREPDSQLCYIGDGPLTASSLASLRNRRISNVSWNKSAATSDLVEQVHAYGLKIYLWSISTPEIETYRDLGVDGLLVNNPPEAKYWQPSPPSSNAQLAQGLVAYWKFDEGLANPAATHAGDIEEHSSIYLAGSSAAPAWIAGDKARLGGALSFDGANDYACVPTNEFVDIGTNAVSISLWVKLSALPSAISRDYAGIYDSTNDAYVVYLDRGARELRFKVTTTSLKFARPGISEDKLQTGIWHHVVGVYDGSAGTTVGQAMIFLDGRIVDIHAGDDNSIGYGLTNIVRRNQAAAIGRNGTDPNYYFSGDMDDVAIWNRALSPTEIRQIYSAGTNGVPLERKIMTIWITGVSTDPETSDMVMEARIDHASATNQILNLRGASATTEPYTQQTAFQSGQGHKASFRVPRPDGPPPPFSDSGNETTPRFFQISCP